MKKFILTPVFVLTFCGIASAAPHKVRVTDPVAKSSVLARGGKLIANYGSFSVLEAEDAALVGISNGVESADDLNFIRLNSQPLDTRAPQVKALRKMRGAFNGRRLHLVHFTGPIKPEWRAVLEQSGVRVVSYIPENAYLIYGDAGALAQMQSWAAGATNIVQWEGDYSDNFKIHPRARALDEKGNPRQIGTDTFTIQLITDTNSNPVTLALIDQLKLAPLRQEFEMPPYNNIVVSLPANRLKDIAVQPDVISIQPYFEPKKRDERQSQILAGNVVGGLPSGPGYLAWLASKGFTQAQFDASGFVVDVADSGIDNGTNTPGHFAVYKFGDTSQSNRLAYTRVEGHLHFNGTLAGCDGHGALNGHIIGGYDDFSGFQHRDLAGYNYGMGVCPFVKLGSSVIFDNSGSDDFTKPNYSTMVSDAYISGARIGNNSWGTVAGGDYDALAQAYDGFVRDARSSVIGNQQMVLVFAAGNTGPCTGGTPGINSPGSAKNVITVGATENVRSLSIANGGNSPSGNDGCGEDDSNADNADDVHCGSSRGPCQDGRMKPDLVAAGTHVTGGVPQDLPPPSAVGTGSAISCFDSLGVCALPSSGTAGSTNNFFPLGQQFYTVSSGTSHAAPAVSGACALVRQFFINSNFTAPSPAMTKAFLINSARYLTGDDANDDLWSPNQGMGEVNLGVAFDGVQRVLHDQLSEDKFTATGQQRILSGTVTDLARPLRVTLAWTDAPGNTVGAAYNNNLDLTVTIGGNTYKGNVFNGQYSTTGGTNDTKNNVESVFLPAGVSGDFTVTITAANINSDGVPNEAPLIDQDFALVIYNGAATNAPTFTPLAAAYAGLFYESNNVQLGKSGAITVNTSSSASYSGKLQMGANRYSFSGTFDSLGAATNSVARKGSTPLSLMLQMDLTDNSRITGTVSDGNWIANLQANRAAANLELVGKYTLVCPGTNDNTQLPGGDGFGTASVDASGKIKLTGSLADGTKLSQSVAVSADGQWPLYVSLYGGQGQILGWLTLTNAAQEDLGGQVNWIKAPIPTAKFYPAGFNFDTRATGSKYNSTANPLLGFGSGVVSLTGADLSAAITNNVSIIGTSVVNESSNKLTMKLTVAKGLFKGSTVNPSTGVSIPFNGAILQKQNFGSGYFLGTTQSGRVFFGP